MDALSLILALHLQVPPGTPERHLTSLYGKLYRPLLLHLRRLESLKVNLHVSGLLLARLRRLDSSFFPLLRDLIEANRIELLGGGWSDCFLFGLPERDALGQLQRTSHFIQHHFQQRPRAAWLTELAWDPVLPRILERVGLQIAVLDGDAIDEFGALKGSYVTEREGATLTLLPADTSLDPRSNTGLASALASLDDRRRRGVEAVTWATSLAGVEPADPLPVLKQMARYFSALDASDHWVKTLLIEETEHRLSHRTRTYPRHWFPGEVTWEQSLVRYDEANRLHKRMLQVSLMLQRVRGLRSLNTVQREALESAALALYQGQDHEATWHGERLGVYEPHLRHALWSNLIGAEHRILHASGQLRKLRSDRLDYDCDGHEEILIRTPHLGAILKPSQSGAMVELDLWELPGNVMNTMTRVDEPYHESLEPHLNLPALIEEDDFDAEIDIDTWLEDEAPTVELPQLRESVFGNPLIEADQLLALGAPVEIPSAEPLTPLPPSRQEVLARKLAADTTSRASFTDHFLPLDVTFEQLRQGRFLERGDFFNHPYRVLSCEPHELLDAYSVSLSREGHVTKSGDRDRLIQVAKRFVFHNSLPGIDLRYDIANRYHTPLEAVFGVQLNIGLDGIPPEQLLEVDVAPNAPLGLPQEIENVSELSLLDPARSFRLTVSLSRPARLYAFPVESVARGARGLEAIRQGVCWFLTWPMHLWGEERTGLDISLSVSYGG